jgi:hypothetical protein
LGRSAVLGKGWGVVPEIEIAEWVEVAEVGAAVVSAGFEAVRDPGEAVGTGDAWWWAGGAEWHFVVDLIAGKFMYRNI